MVVAVRRTVLRQVDLCRALPGDRLFRRLLCRWNDVHACLDLRGVKHRASPLVENAKRANRSKVARRPGSPVHRLVVRNLVATGRLRRRERHDDV